MTPRNKKTTLTIHDVVMYVAVLLKHLRLVILLVCLSTVLGLFYYNFSRPVYYSTSMVNYRTVERPRSGVDADKVFRDSSDRLVQRELSSPHMKERVARRFGVNLPERELMKKYIRKLTVTYNSEKNIEIQAWVYSEAWAKDFAKILVEEYLLYREERRREQSNLIVESFNREMNEIKAKMDELFNAKFDFRDTNELTQILIELNHLQHVPRELFTVTHQISLMDDMRDTLQKNDLDTVAQLSLLSSLDKKSQATQVGVGQVLPANLTTQIEDDKKDSPSIVVVPQMVVSTRPWEDLDKERLRLEDQARELGRVYLSGHPKMIAITKQLDAVQHALKLELQVALNRFNLDYANLLEKKKALEAKLPAYNDITRRHQKYLQEYAHYDTGQLAWSKMHAEMEKRLSAIDYADDKERSYLQYLGTELNDGAVSPSGVRIAIYVVLLSLALGIAVPFSIEYLDSRVSDLDLVEETLRIKGLGVVPSLDNPDTKGLLTNGDNKPDYHLEENFRVIRTNLILNAENPNLPQVLLVTSAMPQEGKTVVSSNLAKAFAMKGEKTLLIDADLRRGRLYRVFNASSRPGLSDSLMEKRPVEEAIRPTQEANLFLLTCGKHINSASELLDNEQFAELIRNLRQKFQRIIIDTPPVLGLAETSIIQRHADGIVFVIWSGSTPVRNVKSAINSLQSNGAKFAGFVLNRLDFQTLGNRYKYFYYAPNYYYNYRTIEAPAETVKS